MPQKRNPIASEYALAEVRALQALVPLMQGAMAQDHERATGPWQSEGLALPQAFVHAHGALARARLLAEGMEIDADRMRDNLALSHGQIMAEAVMMALAPALGRSSAHVVVERACERVRVERIALVDALAEDPDVSAHLDGAALARVTDPSHYLGSAQAFVDRVLAEARAVLGLASPLSE
jgi:3-carboxy-cis,cis-muconate cycloisomerase